MLSVLIKYFATKVQLLGNLSLLILRQIAKLKFFFFTHLLLFLAIPFYGQSVYKLDELYGFKDFKFGTPVSNYSRFNFEKCSFPYDGGDLACFSVNGDSYKLELGAKKIEEVLLFEYNNEIVKIEVGFEGRLPYENLKEVFGESNKEKYSSFGDFKSYKNAGESASWKTNKVELYYYTSYVLIPDQYNHWRGDYKSTLIFKLARYDQIAADIKKEKANNFKNDFGTPIESNEKQGDLDYMSDYEPSIDVVYLLNQKWYQGGGFGISTTGDVLTRDATTNRILNGNEILSAKSRYTDYTFDYSMIRFFIAANKSKKIIYLWKEAKDNSMLSGKSFRGPVKIFLSNGDVITCLDRGLNGSQNTEKNLFAVFSVFYLTDDEFNQLQKHEITGINFKFGDRNEGFQNYSLGENAFGNQAIAYDVKKIKELLVKDGNPD